MAVTFQHKIILRLWSVFCFGTISSVADGEGTLHRITDPPERKSSSKISEKIGAKQGKAQPPALREKWTARKTPIATRKRYPLPCGYRNIHGPGTSNTGCMVALSRFISRLGEKGLPFYKLLKKVDKF
jgi:hypothetical protein